MSFKDQSFSKRFETMGQLAEDAFERFGPMAVRWGQNKTPFSTSAWPEKLRYAPDYIGTDQFFEVQGCGRDQLFKFKKDKILAMTMWDFEFPMFWWLWDETNQRHTIQPHRNIVIHAANSGPKFFPEGKEYFEIPCGFLVPWVIE